MFQCILFCSLLAFSVSAHALSPASQTEPVKTCITETNLNALCYLKNSLIIVPLNLLFNNNEQELQAITQSNLFIQQILNRNFYINRAIISCNLYLIIKKGYCISPTRTVIKQYDAQYNTLNPFQNSLESSDFISDLHFAQDDLNFEGPCGPIIYYKGILYTGKNTVKEALHIFLSYFNKNDFDAQHTLVFANTTRKKTALAHELGQKLSMNSIAYTYLT